MSNVNTKGTAEALKQAAQGLGNNPSPSQPAKQAGRLMFSDFMRQESVNNMIANVLGETDKKEQFISSVISLYGEEKSLRDAQPVSIIQACLKAAVLDLPIDKNLGFAWVIAYKRKVDGKEISIAQCQLGYKAFIQFALRTDKYRKINAIPVYEGEFIAYDRLTEDLLLDSSKRVSNTVIGYAGYFELMGGFKKTVYWSKEDIEAHRQRFSKQPGGSAWRDNFDAMALKTVVQNMLKKWGLLTTQLKNDLKEADESERIDITDEVNEYQLV